MQKAVQGLTTLPVCVWGCLEESKAKIVYSERKAGSATIPARSCLSQCTKQNKWWNTNHSMIPKHMTTFNTTATIMMNTHPQETESCWDGPRMGWLRLQRTTWKPLANGKASWHAIYLATWYKVHSNINNAQKCRGSVVRWRTLKIYREQWPQPATLHAPTVLGGSYLDTTPLLLRSSSNSKIMKEGTSGGDGGGVASFQGPPHLTRYTNTVNSYVNHTLVKVA